MSVEVDDSSWSKWLVADDSTAEIDQSLMTPEQIADETAFFKEEIARLQAEVNSRRTARKSLTPWKINNDALVTAHNLWTNVLKNERSNISSNLNELQEIVYWYKQALVVQKTEGV
jgi:hypothetical protein